MSWDLKEFYRLCEGKFYVKDYIDSLDKKIVKAKIMGNISIEKWNRYFDTNRVDFETNEFYELEFDVEMYMESALQFVHSTGDVLGQILNVTVLEYPLAEHSVSISKVKDRLSTQQNAEKIAIAVDDLLQSKSYQYINAFVNTIKHRSLIGSFTHAEFGKATKNKIGLRFENFKYRGNNYLSEYADDILNIYFVELQTLIENVGIQINKFLKYHRNE